MPFHLARRTDWEAHYDSQADVLYIWVAGSDPPALDGPPDAHALVYNETNDLVTLTLVDVKGLMREAEDIGNEIINVELSDLTVIPDIGSNGRSPSVWIGKPNIVPFCIDEFKALIRRAAADPTRMPWAAGDVDASW